jgi:energy-coupling factor transporter transmembrane protein EcfT
MQLTDKQKRRREIGNRKVKVIHSKNSIKLRCSWFSSETLFYFVIFLMLWIVYFLVKNDIFTSFIVLSTILLYFSFKLFNRTIIFTDKTIFKISYLFVPFWSKKILTESIKQFYCKKEERFFSLVLFNGKTESTIFHSKDSDAIYYIEDILESYLNIIDDFTLNEYNEDKFQ